MNKCSVYFFFSDEKKDKRERVLLVLFQILSYLATFAPLIENSANYDQDYAQSNCNV